uniref:N-terminal Ras-GEF domain-containing protein n=1 Tax=Catagonus wagneri TaxID=51154 RepID=A0A8C3YFF0_9CETA
MLPRPLRLLWDTSPPGGVVLSSFRSRDPEEGGGPGGQGVGGGQEEEEEEEEEEEDEAPVSAWNEEEDGATFTVTSRQYQPLDPLAPRPPPRLSRRLRAGTLEALVRHLLDAGTSGADVTFTAAFLATHRAFTSTPAVLGLVVDRLEAVESRPPDELERTKGVAISVLSTWLASHPEDFGSEVKGQLDRLESFLLRTGYAAGEGPSLAAQPSYPSPLPLPTSPSCVTTRRGSCSPLWSQVPRSPRGLAPAVG